LILYLTDEDIFTLPGVGETIQPLRPGLVRVTLRADDDMP
jgi:hypothetical protein